MQNILLVFLIAVGRTLVLAKSVGNVRNWITIGGVSLQTTEFIKFLYVFIAAGLLEQRQIQDKENIRAFYTVTFLEVLFLALQSEFGTMLLILMLFLSFLFFIRSRYKGIYRNGVRHGSRFCRTFCYRSTDYKVE